MPRGGWIKTNARLIDEVGAEQGLASLLGVLEGDYPRGEDGAAFGFRLTPPAGRTLLPAGPRWVNAIGCDR